MRSGHVWLPRIFLKWLPRTRPNPVPTGLLLGQGAASNKKVSDKCLLNWDVPIVLSFVLDFEAFAWLFVDQISDKNLTTLMDISARLGEEGILLSFLARALARNKPVG